MSYHQMEIEGLAQYYFILFFLTFFYFLSLQQRGISSFFSVCFSLFDKELFPPQHPLWAPLLVICICLFFCPTFQETLCFVDSCTDVAFCVNVRQKNNRNVNCIATTNQNMVPHTCCESNGEKIQSRTLGASLLGHYILLEVIMFTFSFSENGR